MEEEEQENIKKVMFVMRRAPHGTIYTYEGLETILIMAAYEQDISIVFIGDGVFSLVKTQDTAPLGIKGFVKTYGVLDDYDVEKIYVDKQSMEERGLKTDDFIIPVEVKESHEIALLMEEQDATVPY